MPALNIMTAGALKEGTLAAARAFQDSTKIETTTGYTHGTGIVRDFKTGQIAPDIVGLPMAMIRDLQAAGLVREAPVAAVGAIRIALAVRDGDAAPEVVSLQSFEAALRAASQLIYTTAPSGDHIAKVIEAMGLSAFLAPKTVRHSSGAEVNDHLVKQAPAGSIAFGLTTEILFYRDKGVAMAAPLPKEIEDITFYEMAAATRTPHAAAAESFLASLTAEVIAEFYAPTGVD